MKSGLNRYQDKTKKSNLVDQLFIVGVEDYLKIPRIINYDKKIYSLKIIKSLEFIEVTP